MREHKKEVVLRQIFDEYIKDGGIILEEKISQSNHLSEINPSTVNTVRCQTIKTDKEIKVAWCFAKLGRAGFLIDNGRAGGLLAGINPDTGIIETDAVDEFGQVYDRHPDTGIKICGYQYPDWGKMIAICKHMMSLVESVRWVGWDMAHTDSGWVVVEGNSVTEVIGPQSTWKRGFRSVMEGYVSEIKTVL